MCNDHQDHPCGDEPAAVPTGAARGGRRHRRGGHPMGGPPSIVLELRQRGRHRGFGPGAFEPGFGPRGFGPGGHGGPPGGFGPGGPHGRRRRKRGEIRDAILHLLAQRPMHGYEMIQEIEGRSAGRWTPSPGSVYPMLQLLEDEGLISPEQQEGRKVFSLTPTGSAHAEEQLGDRTPPWEPDEGEAEAPHHRMRGAMMQLGMAARQVAQAGDPTQLEAAIAIVEDARKQLYRMLAGDE